MANFLVTGATGFLGRDTVRFLLSQDPTCHLTCLIRAKDEASLEQRRSRLCEGLPADQAARLAALRGDIEQERLGLSQTAYDGLADTLDRVLHIAATTNFDHSLEEARRINVGGTRHAIDLAKAIRKRGQLGRLDYVGTAYVAGDRTDLVFEHELDKGQGFRNTYERSKFEAESLCRQSLADIPVAIYRPSIIVGDSRTGKTNSYKTIYWPMKMLVRFYGLWRDVLPRLIRLPVRPDCPLDIVPVDFVADAVSRLCQSEDAAGQCYHLCAGEHTKNIGEVVAIACDHFGVARLRFIDPEGPVRTFAKAASPLLDKVAPRVTKNAGLMAVYAIRNPHFDNQRAKKAGFVAPRLEEYFPQLLNFAYGTDFGRMG